MNFYNLSKMPSRSQPNRLVSSSNQCLVQHYYTGNIGDDGNDDGEDVFKTTTTTAKCTKKRDACAKLCSATAHLRLLFFALIVTFVVALKVDTETRLVLTLPQLTTFT